MPELPEVEHTARQLRSSIVGATLCQVHVFWRRTLAHPDLEDFLAQIAGRHIEDVRRRGKFLLLDLSEDLFLSIHRRMTGNLLLLPPGWRINTTLQQRDPSAWNTKGPSFYPETPAEENSYSHETAYCRLCFDLADGRRLLYTDPRKFGRIGLWSRQEEQKLFEELGPEPLGEEFTLARLTEGLMRHRSGVKQALLNQRVVAGVGNIYADEALFHAQIHPSRRSDSLTPDEIRLLREAVVAVLSRSIEHGGTSFNDYRDLWGEAGDNYNHVCVYQQDGQPCKRCGTIVERTVIAQRSTHFCPHCQPFTAE